MDNHPDTHHLPNMFQGPYTRRQFVAASLAGLTGVSLATASASPNPLGTALTIQQAIDLILAQIPKLPLSGTVDTVKSGDATQPLKGIITTMFATVDVIRKAIDLGANFIIAHEPTFYNHRDDVAWLEQDEVYQYKRNLLEKNQVVVWRFHDHWHMHRPDGVLHGVLNDLGWTDFYEAANPLVVEIPAMSLADIIQRAKEKLGIKMVKVVGELQQSCERILMLPGAAGGRSHIENLRTHKPDLLICGEVQEWETSEYIRDARAMGLKVSLLVLGHAVSEEPGMAWLVKWLAPKLPGVAVNHVPAHDPFAWV
ncbi:MAG TPA: Nif3-like dinuclear metal center hexameric protein [Ohtaekwangia sp.]|nr:Nif3-like dinuclear metal center hexameric protein [Ohtaekwangia sp.]